MQDAVGKPQKAEILNEMERIFSFRLFKKAAIQRKLIALLIQRSLKGESAKEVEIGYEVFDHYNPESHKVRVTISIIRDKLEQFYSSDGRTSMVRIDLPPGPPYRAAMTFNPNSYLLSQYHETLALLRNPSRGGTRMGYHSLFRLKYRYGMNDECERFAPIYVAAAECALVGAILHSVFDFESNFIRSGQPKLAGPPHPKEDDGIRFERDVSINEIQELLAKAVTIDASVPRANLVTGATYMVWHEFGKAEEYFTLAEKTDAEHINQSLWYAAYLFFIRGDRERARGIVHDILVVNPRDVPAMVADQLFSYSAGDYENAVLYFSLSSYGAQEPFDALLGGLSHLERGDFMSALSCFRRASTLNEEEETTIFRGFKRKERFPALNVMALIGLGRDKDADELLHEMAEEPYYAKPTQEVLAAIAMKKTREVLPDFAKLVHDGDLIARWAQHFPCFKEIARFPSLASSRKDGKKSKVRPK